MNRLFTPSLTKRIIGLIVLGLGLTSLTLIWRSEAVLEDAFLQQTKRQAHVFLLGVEREIQLMPEFNNPKALQQMLNQTAQRNLDVLDFSINQLYIYDLHGKVLAHTASGTHPPKNLDGHYGDVLREDRPYLGHTIEHKLDASGRSFPKLDVIIPLHIRGQVIAAMEAEINLRETLKAINRLDNNYEREIILIILLGTLLVLFFIWWVIHRWLIQPIQTLGSVTHDIANGRLSS
ncbi:MAG: hypothetical protein OEL79_11370, partial [Chromatiales bacterium]|nr:hypothetical protein [Chromatiales bacterium]